MDVSTIHPPTVYAGGAVIRNNAIPGLDSVKALSVCQPYASLLVAGLKTIETRTWSTQYRGKLLICASKKELGTIHDLRIDHRYRLAQDLWGRPCRTGDQLPVGVAVGVVEVVDCRRMTGDDWDAACCDPYPGAYGFVCENAYAIKPFAVRGKLMMWDQPILHRQLDRK